MSLNAKKNAYLNLTSKLGRFFGLLLLLQTPNFLFDVCAWDPLPCAAACLPACRPAFVQTTRLSTFFGVFSSSPSPVIYLFCSGQHVTFNRKRTAVNVLRAWTRRHKRETLTVTIWRWVWVPAIFIYSVFYVYISRAICVYTYYIHESRKVSERLLTFFFGFNFIA